MTADPTARISAMRHHVTGVEQVLEQYAADRVNATEAGATIAHAVQDSPWYLERVGESTRGPLWEAVASLRRVFGDGAHWALQDALSELRRLADADRVALL